MINDLNKTEAYKNLRVVLDDIKALRIQGATAVAVEGIQAFARYADEIAPHFDDMKKLNEHLSERSDEVKLIRVTEPALQNGLRYVQQQIIEHGIKSAIPAGKTYKNILEEAKVKVGRIGAEKILDGSTIMTHCHSSFVDAIFAEAINMGKEFRIVNTETRPLYQGRKTAKKVLEKGIELIHVVDSAMWWAMHKFDVDLVLLGADAATVEGTALNKIGSRLLALSSMELHVPLYICTSLLKYNPETSLGRLSEIEMRDEDEIWPERPEANINIFNPAFETISPQYIAAFITEYGLIPPQLISHSFETNILSGLFKK